MRDPYDVLGVPRKASEAEIKKAFRALAKKHHPDSHGSDPAAVKRFQEINSAYEVLGDKEKRAQFDRGEIDAAGQPRGFNPGAQGFRPGFRPGAGGNARDFHFNWSGADEGVRMEDIFADILGSFGQGGGQSGGQSSGQGGRSRRSQPSRGEDMQFATTVTFAESVQGGSRRVVLPDGRQVEVHIPAGLKDGQQIRLRGQGAPGGRGGPPGDVLITVSVAPHPYLTRDGRDLKMDLPVSLKEAVLGAKVTVPTLSGPITLSVPPHSNTGTVLRLRGKGVPAGGGEPAGDLYARLVVALPDAPDSELETFAKRWGARYDPRSKLR